MLELETYLTMNQVAPYKIWLHKLKDRHAVIRIVSRVERMAAGNYGDIRALGDGVWEARIDWGPGYRIYYAQADLKIILLLLGGDKRKQVSDIQLAKDYLTDWQLRNKHK